MSSMSSTLIITTYNRPTALELVLKSVLIQTHLPNQILIADDGSDKATQDLIEQYQPLFKEKINRNITHVWQEDKGFRLARIRNLAIAQATNDYLIMVDGDMILHPQFIQSHLKTAKQNYFVQGSRVLLSDELTQKSIREKRIRFSPTQLGITNRLNAIDAVFLSRLTGLLLSNKKSNSPIGVRGANMAFWRKDVLAINGFNEDFEGWGREDSEFVVRLLNNGIKRKNLKFGGVAYHLYHNENPAQKNDQLLNKNDAILQATIDGKSVWCKNGLDQHLV